ncbi:MAG: Spy/CpxP family protein refolding chaperone [Bacteroidota bacterium]
MLRLTLGLALGLLVLPASAQHGGQAAAGHTSPADGLPAGVSASEANGLRAGAGMGLARAAELNGYPGPLHVLELADALGLTDNQRAESERLRAEMLAEAVPLGEQILAAETHLDALFAGGGASPEAVDRVTTHLGVLRGRLRAAHLRAHVAMRAALTDEQVMEYDRLRGNAP